MQRGRRPNALWVLGLAAAWLHGVVVVAQTAPPPAHDEPPPPAAGEERRGPGDEDRAGRGPGTRDGWLRQWMELPEGERRARFREFLSSRRNRAERIQAALDEAIRSVDRDVPIEQVMEAFPADLRGDLRPGGGRGAGGPMGEGTRGGSGGGPGGEMGGDHGAQSLDKLNELGPVVPGDEGPGEGGPGGRGRGPREGRGTLSDVDRQAFDEFLGSAAPRLQMMFRKLREQDANAADQRVMEGLPRIRWLLELREKDREMYDLRLKDIRAGREALEAARGLAALDREGTNETGDKRSKLEGDLKRALETQYDLRGQILGREISRLENDLGKRREEMGKRADGRTATVERTSKSLVERAKEMGRRMREHRGGGPKGEGPRREPPERGPDR
jgi:hypothetical protein